MASHLTSEQISRLLQADICDQPDAGTHWGPLHDARSHLNGCVECQTRMRAYEELMESLALIKPSAPGARELQCPAETVWFDMAAGITSDDSASHLRHAAQCDYCGPLLRQTIADFAEELTADEEAGIGRLASATAAWQTKVAARLQSRQSPERQASPRKHPWAWSRAGFLSRATAPWRLAFASVLILLLLLGLRDYRRVVSLSDQNLRSAADILHLEQNVVAQRARIAELTGELNRPGVAATAAALQSSGNALLASLTPDLKLTRGITPIPGVKRLSLPRARIALRLLDTPEGAVRADLLTDKQQMKWSQEVQPTKSEKGTNTLVLSIPGYVLTPNIYRIDLSFTTRDGVQQSATYSFQVIP